MKQIKFLIAVALVSVFAFSCKEAPKEAVEEVVVEEVAPIVEEVAVDSTAAVVEEVIEEVQQ